MPRHDTRVTQIKKNFKKLDTNKDGSLSFAEMGRILRKGRPDLTDRELQILFQQVDKNGNGRIEFGEFVDFIFADSAVSAPRSAPAPEGPRRSLPAARAPSPSAPATPLLRKRQDWDVTAEDHDIAWEQLKRTFFAYAGRNSTLEGSEFSRMCRDCGLYDDSLAPHDVDTIFAYVCSRGTRSMGPAQFQEALEMIAAKKMCPTVAVRAMIAANKGPVLHATKAQDVRFFRPDGQTKARPPGAAEESESDLP